MNKLSNADRAKIVACLCEGNSIRATVRMTGAGKNTIARLLRSFGAACSAYQDKVFRNLKCKRVQVDEVWSFINSKEKNTSQEKKSAGCGDCWTWTAICADSKLVPCWFVGTRDGSAAYHFIHDLKERLANRIQLTSDGHRAYLNAVEDAFGAEVDFAQLVKIYGNAPEGGEVRYSPAVCMGARKAVISGQPDWKHVSTSFAERQNLTMRMSMRRFTRLTNGFSKTLEQHENMLSIYFMYYNFCRIHQTLRVTPAMEAGVSDHVWTLEEIISLLDLPTNERR